MERVTVLLVEDEPLLLLEFEQALVGAGFEVLTAPRGRDALEILGAAISPVNGIVTDIRLGKPPDGWEIARIARENDPQIPVVYISGDSAQEWSSKGVPESIMLEKPFAIAQLVTAISQLLNNKTAGVRPLDN